MRSFVSSTWVSYPPYCLGPFASVIFCFDGIMGPEKNMKPGFYPPWIQNHHFDDVGSSTPKETPDRIKSRKSHLYKSSKPVPNASRRATKKKMEHVPQDWLEEIGSFFLHVTIWYTVCDRRGVQGCAVSVSIWRKPLGHTNSTLVSSRASFVWKT